VSVTEWTREYHLTPHGWEVGTRTAYTKIKGRAVPRPPDAMETWEEHGYQRTVFSQETRRQSLVWHHPDVSPTDRAALRKHYPPPWEQSS